MIAFTLTPQLASQSVNRGFPVVLSFQATSSLTATYLVTWGDGQTERNLLPLDMVRLIHPYARAGSYNIAIQIFASDDAVTARVPVTIQPERERERPLHRWSGPVLGLKSISAYNLTVDQNPTPVEYQLLAPAMASASYFSLPANTVVSPGDRVTVTERSKLVSGGTVRDVTSSASETIVELNFILSDSYSTQAVAQILASSPSYGAVRASGRMTQFSGAKDDDLIFDSVGLILSTRPGERVMRPTFGFKGRELVFEPNEPTVAALGQSYVVEALNSEPRAAASGIVIKQEEHSLSINGNLVFPSGNLASFSHDFLTTAP